VTPCDFVDMYQHSGVNFSLHLRFKPWRWEQ
jgi:hypothetical protein